MSTIQNLSKPHLVFGKTVTQVQRWTEDVAVPANDISVGGNDTHAILSGVSPTLAVCNRGNGRQKNWAPEGAQLAVAQFCTSVLRRIPLARGRIPSGWALSAFASTDPSPALIIESDCAWGKAAVIRAADQDA
ncbi:hypothetical protein [Stagnimonas aquatica]|uniref:hypothetical protein n=1 Tax=Stagnimonas aquatica TaxID=2689987 RepID=UPI0011CEBEFA|nr:hypothetical protein [Stagnimonas aquatica]